MKTYEWNGEYWYECTRSIPLRIRRWLVWLGGWENSLGKFKIEGDPTPIGLLGHRVEIQRWGITIRSHGGYYCLVWRGDGNSARRAYFSTNGSPSGATRWFLGTPRSVVEAAESRGRVRPVADRTAN